MPRRLTVPAKQESLGQLAAADVRAGHGSSAGDRAPGCLSLASFRFFMNILGIETSCDETAAAVVVDGERE
ncbi:MAG: hypothetical protein O3A53_00275, partial [Acidobacteria bacterium]|nr:hypothetical protein [Acidobacteriota bacterium]